MKLGTKSVLYGAHQFLLHPLFVAAAWWKLYGFPWDYRLWLCFLLHDIGYVGMAEMDSEEGQLHPYTGANLVSFLAGDNYWEKDRPWFDFCLLHSRHLAKKLGKPYSRLCVADKYASVLTPWWLYIPMVSATGEIWEYMRNSAAHYVQAVKERRPVSDEIKYMGIYGSGMSWGNRISWWRAFQRYMARWVEEHKDGKTDNWTTITKAA